MQAEPSFRATCHGVRGVAGLRPLPPIALSFFCSWVCVCPFWLAGTLLGRVTGPSGSDPRGLEQERTGAVSYWVAAGGKGVTCDQQSANTKQRGEAPCRQGAGKHIQKVWSYGRSRGWVQASPTPCSIFSFSFLVSFSVIGLERLQPHSAD